MPRFCYDIATFLATFLATFCFRIPGQKFIHPPGSRTKVHPVSGSLDKKSIQPPIYEESHLRAMSFRRMYLYIFRYWENMPRILQVPRSYNYNIKTSRSIKYAKLNKETGTKT
ncbi:hypothetical protein F2Q69_00012598 [Brassica cretica]|uniref:Uncharacterized protein n=1 Tax=Brassica cretica TaxID=69181 RepID=A0A8S9QZH6_BRACR|nr:hypothetical protein F2Q69_00012598 [Brassica cretica]